MATPNNNLWSVPSPQAASQPGGGDEYGLQTRPMGLKVHYTFDRDNQVHCLARWPHILQVQTMPLNESRTIGVVDLRTCLQAVAQCSPEIVNQHDTDYSIYATDYSEANFPLVGQGMMSWAMEQNGGQQQDQLVTGLVTRNIMAILSKGSRDTLEVKLKLTAVPRMQPPRSDFPSMDSLDMSKFAPTPTDTNSEWNSFIQANPILGHSANVASMPSPALPPAQLSQPNGQNNTDEQRFLEQRHDSVPPQPSRPASIPPPAPARQPSVPLANIAPSPAILPRVGSPALAPRPAGATVDLPPARPSRPTSRASKSRSRQPTGRPRGRPRKKPQETGNTSAAEEVTDGDEGPQKKRAKVTKSDYNMVAPFGSGPESLRVTASISGSLRNMRPIGSGETQVANHLQDVPRAPTPVPDIPLMHKQQRRMRALENKAKMESMGDQEAAAGYQRRLSLSAMQVGLSQDAFSPDSAVQSPDQAYSPEDSPADLGSSPPVPRTTPYLPSSPIPSSPVLPAMRMRQVDSGFMSGGIDDMFDEEDVQELPMAKINTVRRGAQDPAPLPSATRQSNGNGKTSHPQERQMPNFPFHEVQPGPPELLPTTSIFNPTGKLKALNRPPAAAAPKKPVPPPSLKRSSTAPSVVSEPVLPQREESVSHQPAELPHGSFLPQTQSFSAQQGQQREASPTNIESVLHHALSREVGSDANGSCPIRPGPSAPTANMMPVPERPESTEIPLTLPAKSPSRPASRPVSRPASRGPSAPTVPASDPVTEPVLTMPRPFMSEAPCPFEDDTPRYSKNQVKKQSIKERLETAIQKGESPPFCANCGAIETPTWRKIWTQEHRGEPGQHQFSDKPGSVTAVDVLEMDPEGQILAHRLVKKHLGPTEDRKSWTESLLCNPCGIWLAKFKGQRPPERWDKDAARLGQPRRKRDNKNGNGKGKKARTKSDAQMNPTSEAYFTTDPLGPPDLDSPKDKSLGMASFLGSHTQMTDQHQSQGLNLRSSPKHQGPGSTHSRGSGTADSPIAIEDDLGNTRRLLFPSPRKDGQPKVLGELTMTNHAQTNINSQEIKSAAADKENANTIPVRPGTPVRGSRDDLDQELFGTPPDRPTTPLGRSESSGVFKTPTRPTPSHRPITRSITRSIRTVRSIAKSPCNVFGQLLKTPSKTPRSSASNPLQLSTGKRRSPRNAHLHAHFAMEDMQFDSPFTATLNQLLSEANEFTAGSPSHGLVDLDLAGLPNLPSEFDSDAVTAHLASTNTIDFGNFLSTDLVMPSSPPLLRNNHAGSMNFGASLTVGDVWAQLENGGIGEMEGVEVSEPS
ncbi:CENP-A multicopy suppressor protein 2 [Podospora aff. communis PSN243]|uniref:CENP-A multicopy suppressor protein 2 n=1 Tax=Podospora aff. communis PSN243 TaxID=3040156 RepID=A0AAV9H1Q1_9PEZI|nr:CENP-A multicopy suppressor protein 2 [Podospora aff. communis PSN243]